MDKNLPQQLNYGQLKGLIDQLVSQKAPQNVVQGFVDNYQKDPMGNYVLKGSQVATPTQSPFGVSDVLGVNQGGLTPSQLVAPVKNYVGAVVPQVQDIGNKMSNVLDTAGKDTITNAKTAFGNTNLPDQGSFLGNFTADLSKRLTSLGHIAGDVAGTAFAPLALVASAIIPPDVKNSADKGVNWLADKITNNPEILTQLNKVNSLLDQNPDLKKSLLSDLPNALALLGGSKVSGANPEVSLGGMKSTIGGDLGALKNTVVDTTKAAATKITDTLAQRTALKETTTIQDMISPKLTAKEIKLAEKQGRIIPGKDPTLLRGGTPDTVIPSDKVVQSTATIQREIPNASKLKQPELYTALDARTTDMAQKLQPEMQKVPIKPATVEKITTDWEALKKQQIAAADATEEANVLKQQKQFEARLQKSKSGTMDDLWNTRKEYDASVPDNVKRANSMSPEGLQRKKEIWLQNREVLNGAINDSTNGMGATSQQAFSDMTDMYQAKTNLLSKAKVELKVQPSKVRQWIKDNPWKSALIAGTILEPTGVPQKAVHLLGF